MNAKCSAARCPTHAGIASEDPEVVEAALKANGSRFWKRVPDSGTEAKPNQHIKYATRRKAVWLRNPELYEIDTPEGRPLGTMANSDWYAYYRGIYDKYADEKIAKKYWSQPYAWGGLPEPSAWDDFADDEKNKVVVYRSHFKLQSDGRAFHYYFNNTQPEISAAEAANRKEGDGSLTLKWFAYDPDDYTFIPEYNLDDGTPTPEGSENYGVSPDPTLNNQADQTSIQDWNEDAPLDSTLDAPFVGNRPGFNAPGSAYTRQPSAGRPGAGAGDATQQSSAAGPSDPTRGHPRLPRGLFAWWPSDDDEDAEEDPAQGLSKRKPQGSNQ